MYMQKHKTNISHNKFFHTENNYPHVRMSKLYKVLVSILLQQSCWVLLFYGSLINSTTWWTKMLKTIISPASVKKTKQGRLKKEHNFSVDETHEKEVNI